MVRVNEKLTGKDKRVRFSTVGDCSTQNKTSTFSNAREPRKYFNNERNSTVGKSTSMVTKSMVRNVEEGIASYHIHLDRRKNTKSKFLDTNCQIHVQTETTCKNKFEAPELYSSLCVAKAIHVVANTSTTSCAEYEHLRMDAGKAVKDKILLKLNIPPEEKLYKDLVPVKIDDAELIAKHPVVRRETSSTYNKDVEPQLSDFCKPTGGREFCMWTKPVLHYGERLKYYDGFSLCKISQVWKA